MKNAGRFRILCVAACAGILGCSQPTPKGETQREPAPDAQLAKRDAHEPKAAHPAPAAETGGDTANALARKTAQYAQSMEPLVANRQSGKAPTTTESSNASVPSEVQWEDPNALKLGATPQTRSPVEPPALIPVEKGAQPPAPVPASATIPPKEHLPTLAIGSDAATATSATAGRSVATATDAIQNRIEKRVHDFPRESAAHLDQQLMLFLQDRPTPDLAGLSTLGAEDRETITILMDGLTNFRSILRTDSNMLQSRKVRPLLEMSDRLRSQSELTLPTVALCKAVKGFGLYEPIDSEKITAGKETKAIVYCEVANFASQLDEKQLWQTKLTQEVVLYTEADGMKVWKKPAEQVVDICRNRRHDFYAFSFVQFPATLPIGRYVLKVSVVDQQANRVAEATVPIAVVAQ